MPAKTYILALDQGTTATTAMVVGPDLSVLGRASNEIPQIYPQPGHVEHDPVAIWETTARSARQAMEAAGVAPADCAGVGITNQRETTILWDRDTGRPRHNAVVWQCRRTAEMCRRLKEDGVEPLFRERTGLVLDPYFSGTKVRWLLDHVPGLRGDAEAGQVCFGTVDSFLLFRLTGGKVHATDVSNASRTLFLNLRTLSWDPDLLRVLDVPATILPEVRPSAGVFGTTRGLDFLPDGVPVAGMAGDQQAALFGQACFEAGQSKCTYGTGAFLLVNTGERPVLSSHGLLTTVAWRVADETRYALEGSSFIAGAAVQWLRDELGLIRASADVEALAASVPDSGGAVFVPALAPHWRPDARGALLGVTRGCGAGHVARAVLEGIAFQVADLVRAVESDVGGAVSELRVDGGASANDLMMQFQADVLGVPVVRPANLDTTAMGAASLAGIGVGLWDRESLGRMTRIARRFEATMTDADRQARLDRFHRAVALVAEFGSG